MKKVLFLMFLLLLIGLGAAGVKAQVRIGGNTPPNPAAALDLNADDSATPAGNKGALALPRVSLASATAQLAGNPPSNGMLVYNTNTSMTGGNGVGMYFWDGSSWVMVVVARYANVPVVLWSLVVDTTFTVDWGGVGSYGVVTNYRIKSGDFCTDKLQMGLLWFPNTNTAQWTVTHAGGGPGLPSRLVCYRPIPLM